MVGTLRMHRTWGWLLTLALVGCGPETGSRGRGGGGGGGSSSGGGGSNGSGGATPVVGEGVAASPSTLMALLTTAEAGDVLRLEAGNYPGPFVIPAGVSVVGAAGVGISGSVDKPAITLMPGSSSQPTILESVTVDAAQMGVFASGEGSVEVRSVTVNAPRGLGMVMRGVTVRIAEVKLFGPIEGPEDEDLGIPESVSSEDVGIVGLAAVDANVTIDDCEIFGFVGYGALFYGSTGVWNGGRIRWTVGTGLITESSTLEILGVAVDEGLQSDYADAKRPGYGLLLSSESDILTSDISVTDIPGMGVFVHASKKSHHSNLVVTDTKSMGVHVQGTGGDGVVGFQLEGGALTRNSKAGLSLLDVAGISVIDAEMTETREVSTSITSTDEDLGHGMQIKGGSGEVVLDKVDILDAETIGLLFDAEGGDVNYRASAVTVALKDYDVVDCFGAHGQNGAPSPHTVDGIEIHDILQMQDEFLEVGALFGTTPLEAAETIGKIGSLIAADGRLGEGGLTVGASGIGGVAFPDVDQ